MNEPQRPTLFYLFPKGDDSEILAMTDVAAAQLWSQHKRWVDIPQKTRAEAEQLRLTYLAARPRG